MTAIRSYKRPMSPEGARDRAGRVCGHPLRPQGGAGLPRRLYRAPAARGRTPGLAWVSALREQRPPPGAGGGRTRAGGGGHRRGGRGGHGRGCAGQLPGGGPAPSGHRGTVDGQRGPGIGTAGIGSGILLRRVGVPGDDGTRARRDRRVGVRMAPVRRTPATETDHRRGRPSPARAVRDRVMLVGQAPVALGGEAGRPRSPGHRPPRCPGTPATAPSAPTG